MHRRNKRRQNWPNYRLAEIRKNAKAFGVEFDLDLEWFAERISKGTCEISGIEFEISDKRGWATPSVDRIDPKGPYLKANCRLILWWLNRALSDWGEPMALQIFEAVLKRRQNAL